MFHNQGDKMKVASCIIRDAYRRAIAKTFGLKQKDIKRDIHIGRKAPGQWSPGSIVEIYCENEIPNATDYFDPSWHGFPGQISYNSEQWVKVDEMANGFIQKKHPGALKFFHEPYNNAVVNIYWS